MSKSIFNLTLDIHNPAPQCSISIKKGDSNRRIVVRLVENGRPYRLSPGSFALFCAKKPDGNTVINECILCGEGSECDGCIVSRDGCTMMGDRIVYDVTYQTTAAVGVLSAQLLVMSSDGGQIASPRFEIVIHDAIYAGAALPSSSEYSAFAALVSEFTTQKEELTSDIEGLEKTHGDDKTELDGKISDLANAVDQRVKREEVVDSYAEADAKDKTDVPLSANAGYLIYEDAKKKIYSVAFDCSSVSNRVTTIENDVIPIFDRAITQNEDDIFDLKTGKLDASVYNDEVPKIKSDLFDLDNREATNNKTRQDQYVDLTKKIATLQALLDGDDEDLNQISEIVKYIKDNHDDIAVLTTDKIRYDDIAYDLITESDKKVLAANQGVVLRKRIDELASAQQVLAARMPTVTEADEGKFAVVVNGEWAAVKLTDVSEVAM